MNQLLLTLLIGFLACAFAHAEEDVFTVLEISKQPKETLPYFIHHAPAETPGSVNVSAKFQSLPEGVSAHLTEIGYLSGRELLAIRYLTDARLANGNSSAVGLVILCGVQSDPPRYSPIFVAWDAGEEFDDFSVSSIHHFGDFGFIWVRRDNKGTSDQIDRVAIRAADVSSPLRAYPLFADDTHALDPLTKHGWELWHRGHFFDEDKLVWHYRLYRPATAKSEAEHRRVQVRYKFRNGKLWPEKAEDDEGPD